ncbi:MAG: 50S ribosomal protein L15 [Gammaproteobacteria bacterium]|nr:50S ribosomal protein L15 [Gammaproteobacteria bacterium]
MRLNDLHPAEGSKKERRRLGRGIGSGLGKTAGRGHKGQTSRVGLMSKIGYEGGQMPMYRRLPKFGFTNLAALKHAEVRLSELAKVEGDVVDLLSLKAANVLRNDVETAKIVLSGAIAKPVTVRGVKVTKGAREAIVAAGGKVEE